jgi:hypothetical protein
MRPGLTPDKEISVAKKEVGKRKPIPVNRDLLTFEDRKALSEQAQKSVLEEMSQDARDAYFAEEMDRLRRGHIPDDQLVGVTMDMAPFLPYIMIDGVQFFHGYTYEVSRSQAMVLFEQQQRSWQHQDEIDGRGKTEAYRRPTNRTLGPQHAGQPTRGANGAVVAEI